MSGSWFLDWGWGGLSPPSRAKSRGCDIQRPILDGDAIRDLSIRATSVHQGFTHTPQSSAILPHMHQYFQATCSLKASCLVLSPNSCLCALHFIVLFPRCVAPSYIGKANRAPTFCLRHFLLKSPRPKRRNIDGRYDSSRNRDLVSTTVLESLVVAWRALLRDDLAMLAVYAFSLPASKSTGSELHEEELLSLAMQYQRAREVDIAQEDLLCNTFLGNLVGGGHCIYNARSLARLSRIW